ncbi:PaaI family thioesterase [Bacillus sp. JJ664]
MQILWVQSTVGFYAILQIWRWVWPFVSTLEINETFTTVELKINYLKPVWNEKIIAKAEVMKRGNTIGLIKCDVFDEGGSLVAHALSTCMILRGEKSAGR